ncbi:MAG: hypothetical protein ACRDAI_07740 [Candidatus Rhabdochlamydia sp.]
MLISSIQAAAQYVYRPINQQITQINQTADWKEKTMLAGLIISVCCAVVTFFTQAALICSAFTLLSAVCGLGSIYMRSYENLKKMTEQLKKLEENLNTLQEENQLLQANNQVLHQGNQLFQSNNQALQKENQLFQANNQTLQEENQRFQVNNQALESLVIEQKDSVTQITFENEKLHSEVTKLNVHTDYLKNTSQELIHSVEKLWTNVKELEPSVSGAQEVEKKLRTFSITMEKQQIVAKNLMEFISKLSVEHSDQLENQKEIIKQLQSLQSNDTTLQKIKELSHLRQQISSGHDKLADVLTKAAQTSTHLSSLKDQLSTLREQYSIENTRLQATRQELSEVSSALQSVLSESRTLLIENKDDTAALAFQIDRLQNLHVELNLHDSDRSNGLV